VWGSWIDNTIHWSKEGAILTVSGLVTNEQKYSLADLKAFRQYAVNQSTTNSGGNTLTVTGNGLLLTDLLNKVGVLSSAKNITFSAPGYSKTIKLSVVTGNPNAYIVIFDDGTLRNVVPPQGAGSWVSNLNAITLSA
jgi:hypothetical protein